MGSGIISNRDRARQLVDFSGLKIDTITPTDIDGFIEYHQGIFIFFELKYQGKDLPRGQVLAFTTLVDFLNKPSIFIIADHETPVIEDIDASKAIVRRYYYKYNWHVPQRPTTLREAVLTFINHIESNPI